MANAFCLAESFRVSDRRSGRSPAAIAIGSGAEDCASAPDLIVGKSNRLAPPKSLLKGREK
jgi:hypothetical protein